MTESEQYRGVVPNATLFPTFEMQSRTRRGEKALGSYRNQVTLLQNNLTERRILILINAIGLHAVWLTNTTNIKWELIKTSRERERGGLGHNHIEGKYCTYYIWIVCWLIFVSKVWYIYHLICKTWNGALGFESEQLINDLVENVIRKTKRYLTRNGSKQQDCMDKFDKQPITFVRA